MSSPGTGIAETGTAMGRVLLVCADSALIQQLAEGMQQLAIATEVCVDVSTALRLLNRKKFEAIIVDFGLAAGERNAGPGPSFSIQSYGCDLCHHGSRERRADSKSSRTS